MPISSYQIARKRQVKGGFSILKRVICDGEVRTYERQLFEPRGGGENLDITQC